MIAIVDCNSFYCSCEKVFRPDIAGKPVVVLSNNDGCIISRDDAAKALGIGMAGPYFKEKPLIEKHGVSVFSSNYNLYGDMSRRVMEVLTHFAGRDNIEVYSVDEAFVTLEGFTSDKLRAVARDMRHTIERWTGIPVSIGIAPTKTLAKLANRTAKRRKELTGCVALLDTGDKIRVTLQQTSVGDLWGVGRKYADKLQSMGVVTGWDLHQLSEEWARRHLGGVVGARLHRELHGIPSIMMKDQLTDKKMIATTRMFGQAVTDLNDIREAVASYTGRAAEKLRRQHSAATMLEVFLTAQEKMEGPRFKHGPTATSYTILSVPTSLTQELIKPAVQLAESLFERGRRYKKAGVILSGLVPDDAVQANLFETGKGVGRFLMEMVDNINFSMRDDMVKFAAAGTKKGWKMRQDFHSPRYTSRWNELPTVS